MSASGAKVPNCESCQWNVYPLAVGQQVCCVWGIYSVWLTYPWGASQPLVMCYRQSILTFYSLNLFQEWNKYIYRELCHYNMVNFLPNTCNNHIYLLWVRSLTCVPCFETFLHGRTGTVYRQYHGGWWSADYKEPGHQQPWIMVLF